MIELAPSLSGAYPLSTYAKFSEKLTFLTPWYAHVRVRIGVRGLEMLVFRKILRKYLMDGSQDWLIIRSKLVIAQDNSIQ